LTPDARRGVRRLTVSARVAAIAALLAIGLAACGGSSKTTSITSASNPAVASAPQPTTPTASTSTPATTTSRKSGSKAHSGPGAPPPPPAPRGHGHHPAPPLLGPVLGVATVRQRADAACATAHSKEGALARPGDFNTNAKAAAAYLNKLSRIELAETQALHLNIPESMRVRWIRFFGNVLRHQLYVIIADNMATTGRGGWGKQLQMADSFWAGQVAPLARQLGLGACQTA
jgi:hypothetical protein